MSENRIDKAIGDVAYVLDSLIALRNIHDTGCCNDCEFPKGCTYKPEWGKPVRYNCPFYVRKEDEGRMSDMCELTFSECTKKGPCIDCDNTKCIFQGKKESDCPKYHCDNPTHDCENGCTFIDKIINDIRKARHGTGE